MSSWFQKRRVRKLFEPYIDTHKLEEIIASKTPQHSGHGESLKRYRDVHYLMNLLNPDPSSHASLVEDTMTLAHAAGVSESEVLGILVSHFGADFDCDISLPAWMLADEIHVNYPCWLSDSRSAPQT